MEEVKKRKLQESGINGGRFDLNLSDDQPSSLSLTLSTSASQQQQQHSSSEEAAASIEELHSLLDPLPKPQLVDVLAKLGSQYPFIAEEIRSVARADPALRKLFVRGLAWETTSETLCAAFEEHGEIEEGAVITDKTTGKSRGYGFITYKDMDSAQRALKAPSKMIDGRMAVCNLACEGLSSTSITPDQAQRKLYIGSLPPEITSEMLLNFFKKHGEIEEGSVAYDKDSNRSRGFGFVTFKTVEAAKRAIDDPQKMLGGRTITVKLADNHKGKVTQTQVPTPVVPTPMHMTGAYPPPPAHNMHPGAGTPGGGYGYPPQQPSSTYPNLAYPSPQVVNAGYPGQLQTSYNQFPFRKDTVPVPPALGGYPYYMPKQQ
ncbi:OLC1v1033828C1 [Oldenlandia corymbosa var. corymbosa]|uniref:OLC1v1033828C1 n=1 Tax=Oldenlandia corymbosa var. corymbosa TaxID=529605 RepID=A0AAV1CS29_OLDCO|nr:OLC1v1033828C1 [Oldenlandia corymbosa var. corymbosa]